jgi:hypothetical protein
MLIVFEDDERDNTKLVTLVLDAIREAGAELHALGDNYPLRSQDPDTERYVVKGAARRMVSAVNRAQKTYLNYPATDPLDGPETPGARVDP